jgi:hypothetical protein
LGLDYLKKYYKDFYNIGKILSFDGRTYPIPRYYDKKLLEIDPVLLEKVKEDRLKFIQNSTQKSQFELDAEEKIFLCNVKKFKRNMEKNYEEPSRIAG